MEKIYYGVDEVMELLGISKSRAYAVMREFNEELNSQKYLVLRGKVPKKFFNEKVYGADNA